MDTKEDVQNEKDQLDARITHMQGQLDDEKFTLIPGEEQSRMTLQREFMQKYSDVLGERIRLWDGDPAVSPHSNDA